MASTTTTLAVRLARRSQEFEVRSIEVTDTSVLEFKFSDGGSHDAIALQFHRLGIDNDPQAADTALIEFLDQLGLASAELRRRALARMVSREDERAGIAEAEFQARR